MDIISFLSGMAWMSVFVSLLLAFFLLTVKTKNKLANRLFATYLLLFAIDNSGIFISEDFIKEHLNLEFFRWTTCSLIFPVFYLYIVSVCFADFRLKTKHLLHAIPFIVENLVFIFRLYFLNDVEKMQFYDHHNQMPEFYSLQFIVEQFKLYCIALQYFWF